MKTIEEMNWRMLIKSSLRGDEYDYTQIPLKKAVILLAIPMMLETSIEALFAITDIFFVARLGVDAVATVGITEAFITLLYAIGIGLSISVTALVARRIGEKNIQQAKVFAGQAIIFGLFLSVVIGITGYIYAKDVLAFVGASQSIIDNNSGYTAIMLGGSVTILMFFILNGICRGAGNPIIAMKAIWLASLINIVLDPCLIFGLGPFPKMGIEGAAIATNLGRGIGICYVAYTLFNSSKRFQLSLKDLTPVLDELMLLIKVSIGGILQFFIATSSWIFMMKIIAEYGSIALAGYTIAIRVIDFIIMPIWGLSNSVSTLVGQNLGANNVSRARDAVYQVTKYNVVLMLLISFVFIVFPEAVIGIFTEDKAVIEIGAECLRILSYGFGLYGLGLAMIQAFNGAGDTYTPTWINVICFWLFQIPMAYWLSLIVLDRPDGVFWAIFMAESLMAVIGLLMFRQNKWVKPL
ncbi:MAG: MATE family efflux transporter [Pseudomonadota bacterium]